MNSPHTSSAMAAMVTVTPFASNLNLWLSETRQTFWRHTFVWTIENFTRIRIHQIESLSTDFFSASMTTNRNWHTLNALYEIDCSRCAHIYTSSFRLTSGAKCFSHLQISNPLFMTLSCVVRKSSVACLCMNAYVRVYVVGQKSANETCATGENERMQTNIIRFTLNWPTECPALIWNFHQK